MAHLSLRNCGLVLTLLLVCVGCSSRTQVSLTSNTPPQFSHVWLTVKEVRFHTQATAAATDSGWSKFTLSNPVTLDLAANTSGTLGSLATSLKLLPGTYAQLRLIPVDSSATLSSSAQTAGALYNAEADYVDAAGTTHQLPLELLNPDQGIGVHASLRVPVGKLGTTLAAGAVGAAALGTSNATSNAGTIDANTTATTGFGTRTTTTTPSTSASTTPITFAVDLDATRDLVPFTTAGGTPGVLLSPHPSAYRTDGVGGIQGTLTLTNLTGITGTNGVIDLAVSAETLSADGSRHVVVATAPVQTGGNFLVYPLPASSSSATSYDLVIHGSGIATIIVRAVQLTLPSGSATATTQNGATSVEANTTGGSPTTVSVGTLTPRAVTAYQVNVKPAGTALPADSAVSFYQTPAGGSDVPFVIETAPIDPFNQTLARAQSLAPGTIDVGTYVASGNNITLVSSAPAEGAGTYRVAALAPGYVEAAANPTVAAPASGTQAPTVALPAPVLDAPALPGTILVALTVPTAGKYTHGEVVISHDGTLVAQAPLDAALTAGGNVSVAVPANVPTALYFASVRVWGPAVPATAPQRQWFATPADLRTTLNASLSLTVD